MNPYTIYAIIGIWLASISGTAWITHNYTVAKADQSELSAVKKAIKVQKTFDNARLEVELEAARKQQKIKVVYRDRIKIVKDFSNAHDIVQCFDNDGVRLFNQISSGMGDASTSTNPLP